MTTTQGIRKIVVFIDGQNLLSAVRDEHPDKQINFLQLLAYFKSRGDLTGAYIYVVDSPDSDDLERNLRLDGWLRFQTYLQRIGYRIRSKLTKEIHQGSQTTMKGNMDVEIATDAAIMVPVGLIDELILVSGDSDFAYLLRRVQDFGVKTVVVFPAHKVSRELHQIYDEFVALESLNVLDKRAKPQIKVGVPAKEEESD